MSKKIVVNLQGGLGNQLFQFYAGLDLALRTGSNLKINTTFVKKGHADAKVDLEDFHLPGENLLSWGSRSRIFFHLERIFVRLSRTYKPLSLLDRICFRNFRSNSVGWDSELEKLHGPIRITGYFQTFKHIAKLSSEKHVETLRLKKPSNLYLNYEIEIRKVKPIVLHIRRGDYVTFSDYYGLLSIEYYLSALNYLRRTSDFHDSPIWVFTDDNSATSQSISDLFESTVRVIDEERSLSSAETLMLMSQGSAIVSANSTFSYWALMQSSASTKKIVPGTWYQNSLEPLDLIPSDWIRLPSRWV